MSSAGMCGLILSTLMRSDEVHLRLRSIEAIEDRPDYPSGLIPSSNPQSDSDSRNRQSLEQMLESNGSLSY